MHDARIVHDVNTLDAHRRHLRNERPPDRIRNARIDADKVKLNATLREPLDLGLECGLEAVDGEGMQVVFTGVVPRKISTGDV